MELRCEMDENVTTLYCSIYRAGVSCSRISDGKSIEFVIHHRFQANKSIYYTHQCQKDLIRSRISFLERKVVVVGAGPIATAL